MLTMNADEKQVFEIKKEMKYIKLILDQLERQTDFLRSEFFRLEDIVIDLQENIRKAM